MTKSESSKIDMDMSFKDEPKINGVEAVERGRNYRDKVVLAPMVRIGSLPWRLTCLKYKADLVYSPELVDKSIIGCTRVFNPKTKTYDYLKGEKRIFQTSPAEKEKIILQLGTASAELALKAALTVVEDVSGIDVNCGCPKKFSIQGGMGAALLSDPDRLINILETLVKNVPIPITCKIRLLDTLENTLELCKRIEKTGVHAIAIHCRTRDERPSHPAHYEYLKAIVEAIPQIPIILNGDVYSYDAIEKLKSDTGVSSIMIARGAIKNPSIFQPEGPTPFMDTMQEYLRHCIDCDVNYQTAKYTLMQAYDEPKSGTFLKLQSSKSMEAISQVIGIHPYWKMKSVSCEMEPKKLDETDVASADGSLKRKLESDKLTLQLRPGEILETDMLSTGSKSKQKLEK